MSLRRSQPAWRAGPVEPLKLIWLAVTHGTGGAKPYFVEDMLELFRQFAGKTDPQRPTREQVVSWMDRWPSGLDPRIVKLREENRDRIVHAMDAGEVRHPGFEIDPELSAEQKFLRVLDWWKEPRFHLAFAARTAEALNGMLGESLDPDTMRILRRAERRGIPFFVNPYYLSLLHVRVPYFAIGADLAIRDYVVYSSQPRRVPSRRGARGAGRLMKRHQSIDALCRWCGKSHIRYLL